MKKKQRKKKQFKKSKKPKSMLFVVFRRDHLRFTSGIIYGSGSFAVQFGDHYRSGDVMGAVQNDNVDYRVGQSDTSPLLMHISLVTEVLFEIVRLRKNICTKKQNSAPQQNMQLTYMFAQDFWQRTNVLYVCSV